MTKKPYFTVSKKIKCNKSEAITLTILTSKKNDHKQVLTWFSFSLKKNLFKTVKNLDFFYWTRRKKDVFKKERERDHKPLLRPSDSWILI